MSTEVHILMLTKSPLGKHTSFANFEILGIFRTKGSEARGAEGPRGERSKFTHLHDVG